MSAIRDLDALLANLQPMLDDEAFVFVAASGHTAAVAVRAFAIVREDEGETLVIAARYVADPPAKRYARITLAVHSSLDAVGLTAAVSDALACVSIPANVIAGYYHDHLFVPYERRFDAMAALNELPVTKVS